MFTDKTSVLTDAKTRMSKAVDVLSQELMKLRTGRASLGILDDIKVDYYGNPTPLNQVATLNIPEPRMITIQPWEANMIAAIEKVIMKSGIGLNPVNDGKLIRLPIPALNEERRKELVKVLKHHGEDAKVAVRNIRRDANDSLKKLEKEKHVSEDEVKKGQTEVQDLTDKFTGEVDKLVAHKEEEIMTV